MIRGEPAIGRDQSRETRLYSVEPVQGPDHEAVIRFCGHGSEAAGPFSQRHCSHSRMRIAATSDRHRLPGASSAVRCRTLFVLSRSLECCSRRRPQLDAVRPLAGRDQAPERDQQFARQCHDHRRLARAARSLGPRALPARQRTVFLEHQEAPRQLDHSTSYPRIAGLGQALLSTFETALVGRSREPGVSQLALLISTTTTKVEIGSNAGWIDRQFQHADDPASPNRLPRLREALETSLGDPSETILIVEDDPEVRGYIVNTLRDLKYQVREAPNAEVALNMVERESPHVDLLLTDVVLPGMNGQLSQSCKHTFRLSKRCSSQAIPGMPSFTMADSIRASQCSKSR